MDENNPLITKEAITELQKALTPVVEKLGQGGEWVYTIYKKQVYVDALTNDGGWLIFWAVLLIILSKKKAIWDKFAEDIDAAIVIGIYWTISVFLIFGVLVSLTNIIAKFINPDYYVLQQLLSLIK